eukprot:9250986-Alexandrium_andersonii.AAC.1
MLFAPGLLLGPVVVVLAVGAPRPRCTGPRGRDRQRRGERLAVGADETLERALDAVSYTHLRAHETSAHL